MTDDYFTVERLGKIKKNKEFIEQEETNLTLVQKRYTQYSIIDNYAVIVYGDTLL